MKSFEHLSYDPIDFADELAKLDVIIAEKVNERKLKLQEEKDGIIQESFDEKCGQIRPDTGRAKGYAVPGERKWAAVL